jgi:hypothetical protein
MIALYERQISKCRTENQINQLHLALGNCVTPREFQALADGLPAGGLRPQSRAWIEQLSGWASLSGSNVPEPFVRYRKSPGMNWYSAGGDTRSKALVLCFCGRANRLMIPIPTFLQHLSASECDVLILKDTSANYYGRGLLGADTDIDGLMRRLEGMLDRRAYRSVVSFGTSMGGLPAIWATLQLRLDRGVSIGGMSPHDPRIDFMKPAKALKRLAAQYERFPELVLVHGAQYANDKARNAAIADLIPSQIVPIDGVNDHNVIAYLMLSGKLKLFLSSVLAVGPG